MAYTPTTWINDVTSINDTNLNKIENGINNNAVDITELQGGMKFMGVISSLPQTAEMGDVYQASSSNIINFNRAGDLIVCVTDSPDITWHVIPSGSRGNGTVTRVQAGNGISIDNGGVITGEGTISLDPSYSAIPDSQGSSGRAGLMSLAQANKLANVLTSQELPQVAKDGEYSSLLNKPPMQQDTSTEAGSELCIMSQKAISEALDTKSDNGHQHTISNIPELADILPDGGSQALASANHSHGNITTDGKLATASGRSYLKTDINKNIISSTTVSSSDIDGVQFGSYNLMNMSNDISAIKGVLTPEGEVNMMEHAAKDPHTHHIFGEDENIESPGFVSGISQDSPAHESPEQYVLSGTGAWVPGVDLSSVSAIINAIYPIGSYYETSDTSFDPNVAWAGTYWELETPGQIHISSGKYTEQPWYAPAPYVSIDFNVNGALTNKSDGGSVYHGHSAQGCSLTIAQLPQHVHASPKYNFYVGQGDVHFQLNKRLASNNSEGAYHMVTKSKNKFVEEHQTTAPTGEGQAHTHSIVPAQHIHPYIVVKRWHRINPPENTSSSSEDQGADQGSE